MLFATEYIFFDSVIWWETLHPKMFDLFERIKFIMTSICRIPWPFGLPRSWWFIVTLSTKSVTVSLQFDVGIENHKRSLTSKYVSGKQPLQKQSHQHIKLNDLTEDWHWHDMTKTYVFHFMTKIYVFHSKTKYKYKDSIDINIRDSYYSSKSVRIFSFIILINTLDIVQTCISIFNII